MSVLSDVKALLGLRDVTAFDPELILLINSAFSTLHNLGIGPDPQAVIKDDTATWRIFRAQSRNMESVKEYVYLAVRIVFDPPTSGTVLEATQNRLKELAFRLQTAQEVSEYEQNA